MEDWVEEKIDGYFWDEKDCRWYSKFTEKIERRTQKIIDSLTPKEREILESRFFRKKNGD